MLISKPFLTTKDVADLFGVQQRAVCHWIDSGHLPGHRNPGNTGHRRVDRQSLINWLSAKPEYKTILEKLDAGKPEGCAADPIAPCGERGAGESDSGGSCETGAAAYRRGFDEFYVYTPGEPPALLRAGIGGTCEDAGTACISGAGYHPDPAACDFLEP
jgi:excisionase family DNA binding protein